MLGYEIEIQAISTPSDALSVFTKALPVVDLGHRIKDEPGVLAPEAANMVVDAIRKSVDAIKTGECSGLVTAPIHKANLYKEGFDFPGHTEFLASLCADKTTAFTPIMMLAHGPHRAVPVTIHMPLRDVFDHLTSDLIVKTVRIVYQDLQKRFHIPHPHIA